MRILARDSVREIPLARKCRSGGEVQHRLGRVLAIFYASGMGSIVSLEAVSLVVQVGSIQFPSLLSRLSWGVDPRSS